MRSLFRLLLRIHPRSYRERFGPEIVEHAAQECARAFEWSRVRGVWCVAATCLDLAWSGAMERRSPTWVDASDESMGRGGETMMGRWMRHVRHAARTLRKAPGFTVSAVLTLALALGANAGIFSVVDAVLLDPLPYENPDRLVHIAASAPGSDLPDEFGVAAEFYVHYRDESTQLEDLATFNSFTATVRADDRVERLRISSPSRSLFTTLGVTPVLGRLPREGEGERVALLSHALWTTWFGGDPSVIGRTYDFIGEPREIIGVMGPGFRFPRDEGDVMAWVPIEFQGAQITEPGRFGIQLVGRLAPGADQESLARELARLAHQLPELYGGSSRYARLIEQHVPVVRSLEEWVVGPLSGPLWMLLGAAALVLLIACANVANLFAVHFEGRGRDLAVKRAIGAARGDLFRSQLSEAFVVAALAGAGALVLAWLVLPGFRAAAPGELSRIGEVHVSTPTVLFTLAASFAAALLCGLIPAVRSSEPDLDRLRDGSRGSTRGRRWARDGLVVWQTALTLVLLVGSGLLMRTFWRLHDIDPGYDTSGVLTFQFAPEQARLSDGPSWARFHQDVMDRIRGLPRVEAVGIVNNVPLDESPWGVTFVTEEMAGEDAEIGRMGSATFAGGDYFEAMGIEVVGGRGFTEEDLVVPGRVVASRAAAELLWPGEDPIGRRVSTTRETWYTVVGVVEDIRPNDLRVPPEPLVYFPMVGPEPDSWALTSPGYVVRTDRPEALMPEIRSLIREVAPEAPIYRVYTMEDLVARSVVRLSFTMLTLGVAAALALVLGAIGLYGVLSHAVAERTREIGVRIALGAEASRVRRMVVGEGARIVVLGIVLGLAVAFAATRALSGLLYGVPAVDFWTFAGMSLVLAVVGLLASYVPARRASRVDPMESMRVG